jgi:hypothetical protein
MVNLKKGGKHNRSVMVAVQGLDVARPTAYMHKYIHACAHTHKICLGNKGKMENVT